MRLTSLSLKQFKAFREAHIEFAPLTVFIGKNNAGKSSLLHALTLLAQSSLSGQVNARSPVDLGQSPSVLIHRGPGAVAGAGWEIGLLWAGTVADVAPGIQSYGPVYLGLDTTFKPEGLWDIAERVEITDEVGRTVNVRVTAPNAGRQTMSIDAGEFRDTARHFPSISEVASFHRRSTFSFEPGVTELPSPAAEIVKGGPGEVMDYVLRVASPLLMDGAPRFFERFRYVGPNRHVDQTVYPLGQQLPTTINGPNDLMTLLAYRPDVLSRVSERCRQVFGYEITLQLVPSQQVSLTALGPGHSLNLTSMGTGLVQMLWVLTTLEMAASGNDHLPQLTPAVGLEEPELHLHPSAQSDVAKILAHFATSGLQVVCTTQSEHLLMALLTVVLSGELPAESLYVYYVQDGRAERLIVDERGQIEGGLRGFFEGDEDQLRRYIGLLRNRC